MKIRYTLLILFAALASFGCSEDVVVVDGEAAFYLSVRVVDDNGVPLDSIRVSVWNMIDGFPAPSPLATSSALNAAAATTIQVAMEREARMKIDVYDAAGNLISPDYIDEVRPAGTHSFLWPGQQTFPNGAYRVVFFALDKATGVPIFNDESWMNLADFSAAAGDIGLTDNDGIVTMTNQLWFPYLDPARRTIHFRSATGVDMGAKDYDDRVQIILAEERSAQGVSRTMIVDRPIMGGGNNIEIVFVPSPQPVGPSEQPRAPADNAGPAAQTGLEWELRPNYPNPFN